MRKFDVVLLLLVTAIAALAAAAMFSSYHQHPELLWRGDPSDRSGHFSVGLSFALALRHFDLAWFWRELSAAIMYPPLHGLLLSAVLLVGGIDVRLGTVPSLLGWAVTIILTWLIARRLFRDTVDSIFAASVAVIFAVASPTFRLLASDVMLECLGSALTALSVYLFMNTYSQPESKVRWRLLAVALTLLFLEKYNYWGLTVVALALTWMLQHRKEWSAYAAVCRRYGPQVARAAAADPLVWICAALAGLIVVIYWRSIQAITLFGLRVSVYPPNNLTTIAYAVLFGRVAFEWIRHVRVLDAALGSPAGPSSTGTCFPLRSRSCSRDVCRCSYGSLARPTTWPFSTTCLNMPAGSPTASPWGRGLLRWRCSSP